MSGQTCVRFFLSLEHNSTLLTSIVGDIYQNIFLCVILLVNWPFKTLVSPDVTVILLRINTYYLPTACLQQQDNLIFISHHPFSCDLTLDWDFISYIISLTCFLLSTKYYHSFLLQIQPKTVLYYEYCDNVYFIFGYICE